MVSVADCAELEVPTSCVAKVRLLGEGVAFGPETSPVPLKLIVCGLPAALSVMVTEAVRGPLWAGLKVTVMVQLAPAARPVPHVLVWLKSAVLVPVTAMLLMVDARPLGLESVTWLGALVVPTTSLPKFRLVLGSEARGICSRTENE